MSYKLENWSVTRRPPQNTFTAPELSPPRLTGNVFGHPGFDDGKEITSSAIDLVNGRVVTTISGGIYELGEPDAEYIKWCEEQGCHVPTEEEPIRLT